MMHALLLSSQPDDHDVPIYPSFLASLNLQASQFCLNIAILLIKHGHVLNLHPQYAFRFHLREHK